MTWGEESCGRASIELFLFFLLLIIAASFPAYSVSSSPWRLVGEQPEPGMHGHESKKEHVLFLQLPGN